jgi:hypothetical protein
MVLEQEQDTLLRNSEQVGGPQLREALKYIDQIVRDGLNHGYFRCSISVEMRNSKRRELVVEAVKSHKFTIPEDELPR